MALAENPDLLSCGGAFLLSLREEREASITWSDRSHPPSSCCWAAAPSQLPPWRYIRVSPVFKRRTEITEDFFSARLATRIWHILVDKVNKLYLLLINQVHQSRRVHNSFQFLWTYSRCYHFKLFPMILKLEWFIGLRTTSWFTIIIFAARVTLICRGTMRPCSFQRHSYSRGAPSNPSVCLVMGGNVATMHSNGIPVGPELGLRKLGVVFPRASEGV